MAKNVLIALALIVLSVLVMIFNTDAIHVNLVYAVIKPAASLVYLFFVVLGVIIGVLLK
ncbi:MAG: hypothetical protein WCI20_01675 [bacterium]